MKWHPSDKRIARALNVLIVLVVLCLIGLLGFTIWGAFRPAEFDPITFETVSVQLVDKDGAIIIPQVDGYEAPSVYLGDPVPTFIQRCSSADEPFDADATAYFVNQDTGIRYTHTEILNVMIESGCVQIRVIFDMPQQMVADLQKFGEDFGVTEPFASVWYIEGTVDPKKSGGVSAPYVTELFTVVHRPTSLPGG